MTSFKYMAVLCGAVLLASCEKNAVQDIAGDPPKAQIRFFNFGLNAPGVNFYANDVKMTALTSATGTESTTGVNYGGVGSGGYYAAIAPGQYTVTGKIAATVDKDLAVASLPVTIADGKTYSFYISGLYNTVTKNAEGFLVEDPFKLAPDFSVTTVRFVNAIYNSTPMTLYARNTTTLVETAIGGAVAYKGAGAFTDLPSGTYDLSTRATGSATDVITRAGVGFTAGHVFTISARGDITVVSTTATNRPVLDNTANR